jgi:hypothetical protein
VGFNRRTMDRARYLTPSFGCSLFVLMGDEHEQDGQIYTLGLLERLREDLRVFGGAKNELYFRIDKLLRELANPNLHDVFLASAFRIELWDRFGRDDLRMVIAVTSSISIAHAAFDAAKMQYVGGHLTLRKGGMLLRDNLREPSKQEVRS